MKATVKYSLSIFTEEIDLTEYGHDEDVKFEDLTEQEQNEITDSLAEQKYIAVSVTTIED